MAAAAPPAAASAATFLHAELELPHGADERTARRLGDRARDRLVRAVVRHGGHALPLPPASVLGVWEGVEPVPAVRAAEELRGSAAQLGEGVVVRGAIESGPQGGFLSGPTLDAVRAVFDLAAGGEVLVGPGAAAALGDDAITEAGPEGALRVLDGSRAAPPPPPPPAAPPRTTPEPQVGDISSTYERSGRPPRREVRADRPDEALAELFDARDWDALRALFAPGFVQRDHRSARLEDGWGAEAVVEGWAALAEAAPDARAVVQPWEAGPQGAGGVLRIAGHRKGRPFETAVALVLAVTDDGVAEVHLYPLSDRAAARERLAALLGTAPAPPDSAPQDIEWTVELAEQAEVSTRREEAEAEEPPEAEEPEVEEPEPVEPEPVEPEPEIDPELRHAAQLTGFCAWLSSGQLAEFAGEWLTDDFVHADHRDVAGGAGERDREGFLRSTESSLEMIPGLRAEAELLAVDGDRRVARVVWAAEGVALTTFVLGRLDGERLGRQDVFAGADEALDALAGAAVG